LHFYRVFITLYPPTTDVNINLHFSREEPYTYCPVVENNWIHTRRKWDHSQTQFISRNQPKWNHSIYDYMRFVVACNYICEHLQLEAQISTILVIFTTIMRLLEISSYWLDQFYIYFHSLIGWYVPLVTIVTKLVASYRYSTMT
jgi:hypothetical protein